MRVDPFTIIYILFAFNLVCGIVCLLFIASLLARAERTEEDMKCLDARMRQDREPLLKLIAESQEMTAKMIAKEAERIARDE